MRNKEPTLKPYCVCVCVTDWNRLNVFAVAHVTQSLANQRLKRRQRAIRSNVTCVAVNEYHSSLDCNNKWLHESTWRWEPMAHNLNNLMIVSLCSVLFACCWLMATQTQSVRDLSKVHATTAMITYWLQTSWALLTGEQSTLVPNNQTFPNYNYENHQLMYHI